MKGIDSFTNKTQLLSKLSIPSTRSQKYRTRSSPLIVPRYHRVLAHIDGSDPPSKTDPTYENWTEIDAIILQWNYGTISDDLLTWVLEPDSTAYEASFKIQNIFLNNKGPRAAALEHEFTNLTLRAMSSLEAYCQRLKDLANVSKIWQVN
ncbi:uncharacterized protein LOC111879246 [Lactuca sativa]|uniref:uncharacterized protein LOC111879246 n=1 Tax=Lactuca sativa TaxID=4236 RepID=UPI000CD9BDEF|nr:uncharacterized protein LOC111879246 [Lactuca sativa]